MACDVLKANLDALNAQLKDTEQSLAEPALPAKEKTFLQNELNQTKAQITITTAELNQCLQAVEPHRVDGTQPARILELRFQNTAGGFDGLDDWAKRIAGGAFPLHSGLEWKQVLDSDSEYDQFNPVGASGWAINPQKSTKDTPFNHPFGNDWEFDFDLDPQYRFLLAPNNEGALLGVELDQGLIPSQFQAQVTDGDRIAVLGRWIVDCGHPEPAFQSEIHPPMVMASASVYRESNGSEFTRVAITSRPYLVGQTFTQNRGDIYNDNGQDDGHLFQHLVKEVVKAETIVLSHLVEAHPKIKSYPFMGAHYLEIVVRNLQRSPGTVAEPFFLAVSFRFNFRSGCGVQVVSNDESSVRILISLNQAGYTPPPLPHRNDHMISPVELAKLDSDAGLAFGIIEAISADVNPAAALILAQGVETDQYDPLPGVDFFGTQNAVLDKPAKNIPGGAGLIQDDSQPYPVFGWLDLKWLPHSASTLADRN